jgi:predicted transcriptional regulator
MLVSTGRPTGEVMADNKVAQFKKELESILSGDKDLVEKVMERLDRERILHYQSSNEVALFSTAGRILYTLMLDPYMTQRALAVYLDLSETMIEKTLKTLIEQGLITKTKFNRKNVYTFDTNLLLKNADIQRMPAVLKRIHEMSRSSQEVVDEAPF